MSYYQDVVVEYLRADRARFVNTEYLIQLNPNNESKGTFWYCDAVAVSFSDSTIYLCEVTYSKTMTALIKRLRAWSANWSGVRAALIRDAQIPNPKDWAVKLWLFVPAKHEPPFEAEAYVSAERGNRRRSDAHPGNQNLGVSHAVESRFVG